MSNIRDFDEDDIVRIGLASARAEPETDLRRERVQEAKAGVSFALDAPPPKVEWVVEKLLPKGVAGVMAAPGGTGKGFMALELGISVSAAVSFGGLLVPERRGVTLVDVEDARAEFHRRLRAQLDARFALRGGLDLDLRESVRENLRFFDLVGVVGAKLDDRMVGEVVEIAKTSSCAPGLVILNHLTQLKTSKSLNDDDVADALAAAARIAYETGALTLVAAHSNKWSMRSGELDRATSVSGNVAIVNLGRIALSLWQLTPDELLRYALDPAGQYVEAKVAKANLSGTAHPPLVWRRVEEGALAHAEVSARNVTDDQRALEILRGIGEWADRERWRKAAKDPDDDGPELPRDRMDSARARLVARRAVVTAIRGKRKAFAPADSKGSLPPGWQLSGSGRVGAGRMNPAILLGSPVPDGYSSGRSSGRSSPRFCWGSGSVRPSGRTYQASCPDAWSVRTDSSAAKAARGERA